MGEPRKVYIPYNYEEIKYSQNSSILLGEIGVGKTSLFNKLIG